MSRHRLIYLKEYTPQVIPLAPSQDLDDEIFRSGALQRIKDMINIVNEKLHHQEPKPQSQKQFKIDDLYARPYSMTTSNFEHFCETQNTRNSYHAKDLTYIVNKLNQAGPLNRQSTSHPTLNNGDHNLSMSPQPGPSKAPDTGFLYCEETIPLSTSPKSPVFSDFDSDDSVKDKDYVPDDTDIDSDNKAILARVPKKKCSKNTKGKKSTIILNKTKVDSMFSTRKPLILRRQSIDIVQNTLNVPTKKRRMTTDIFTDLATSHLEYVPTIDGLAISKRKKHDTPLKQRQIQRKNKKLSQYRVKPGCDAKCIKKCSTLFSNEEREIINTKYWSLKREEMRMFIRSNYTVAIPKRKYTTEPKRNPKREFTLQKSDGTLRTVCKIYFLTTLGFKRSNDIILTSSLDTQHDVDKRGKHTKNTAFDRDLLTKHVESFNPCAPHYRREHAPNRRYLPNEINISFMYKDFCSKYPDLKIGYDLYRSHLKTMNISFTRLGNEECELCESYKHHTDESNHDVRKQNVPDCDTCLAWAGHYDRYRKARELYNTHKTLKQNNVDIYFSSDLEKIIMLPRLEMFKAVIFCPRLTVFNQSFAPVGKITKDFKPLAAIWHDGIAGRKQEDIMSAYYNFFLRYRDVTNIHIWLDNCTSQNKNWLFYSMLVDIINSDVVSTETITLYYFEPGHTFMSCDQFHHQVELSMKRKGKIYDFTDFEETVASSNNGRVDVKALQPKDFINFPNNVSDRRIQNSCPRVYLKNINQVCFRRSCYDLNYKNNFSDEYQVLKFLSDKYLKNPQFNLSFRTLPKGIEVDRKLNILNKLSPIIPKHKMLFWKELPTIDVVDVEKTRNNNTRKTN